VKGNLRWSHEIKASELRLPENRSPGVKASGE
jgi:hypothetical protein